MSRLAQVRSRLRSTSPTDQAVRIALGLMLLSGAVAGTSASFNSQTTNTDSAYATDAVYSPASVTATASANNVILTWPSGALGSGSTTVGHRVYEASAGVGSTDGQTEPSCPAVSAITTVSTTVSALTWTDTGVATATGNQGSWYCYRVQTTFPQGASPTWFSETATNPVAKVQIGHVLRKVQFVDGPDAAANTLSTGDQLVMTYSQPVAVSAGSNTPADSANSDADAAPESGQGICVKTGQELNIGRTGLGNCGNTETNWVATVTGITMGSNASWYVDWEWTDCPVTNQCRVLTATLGTAHEGSSSTITYSGSTLATPLVSKLLSATGSVGPCTQTNNTARVCRPTPHGTV